MSNASDRLAVIKKNYDDASNNETGDLANAKTLAQMTAIQANVALARSTYYSAIEVMLSKTSTDVESAYQDTVNAQNAIVDARKKADAIIDLLKKLDDATDKAISLLNKAKSL